MSTTQAANATTDREIVISRLINAPREMVWMAWTDPNHVDRWWGPNGFNNATHEMSVKPGGMWRFMMYGPNNMNFPNRITFIEVVKPERLVYEHDCDVDNDPNGFHVTVTFEEKQGKTLLTMRSLFRTAEKRRQVIEEFGALEGGLQHLNNLEEHLATLSTQSYQCTIAVNTSIDKAFEGITKVWDWWTKNTEGETSKFNDVFTVHFGATFVTFKIIMVEANKRMLWHVMESNVEGLKDKQEWTDTEVAWELSSTGNVTTIHMSHVGLVPEVECYEDCQKGWNFYVGESLLKLLNDGQGKPDTKQADR